MDNNDLMQKLNISADTNDLDGSDYIELASVIDAEKEVIQQAESKILLFAKQLIETDMDDDAKGELEIEMLNIQSQVDQLRESCAKKEQALNDYLKAEQAGGSAEAADSSEAVAETDQPDTVTAAPPIAKNIDPTIRIQAINDGMADEWNSYVADHSQATLYHYYGWRPIAERQLSSKCLYLAAIDLENNIVGILPLLSAKTSRKTCYGFSLPFSSYGGPLADSENIAKRLLWRAIEIAKLQDWNQIEVKSSLEDIPWQSKSHKVHLISSVKSAENAYDLDSFEKKIREQIESVALYKPTIHFGKDELLGDFYKVYAKQAPDKKGAFFSKAYFAAVLQSFPESCQLAVVEVANKPLCAALLVSDKDTLEISSQVITKKCRVKYADEWFNWQLFQYAAENAYKRIDFGLRDASRTAMSHEKFWGAERVPYHLYYWVKEGASFETKEFPLQKPSLLNFFA